MGSVVVGANNVDEDYPQNPEEAFEVVMGAMKGNIPFRVGALKNFDSLKWECALQKFQQKLKNW